jgi:DNA-binding transcriptional ArsR family regulator
MASKGRTGRRARRKCQCLPEVLPPVAVRALDEHGGVKGLATAVPTRRALEREASMHAAMADPLRLRIMGLLALSPLCVCVIRATTEVEDSRLSYHLGVLKRAGLVAGRKDGSWIVYELTDRGRLLLSAGGP